MWNEHTHTHTICCIIDVCKFSYVKSCVVLCLCRCFCSLRCSSFSYFDIWVLFFGRILYLVGLSAWCLSIHFYSFVSLVVWRQTHCYCVHTLLSICSIRLTASADMIFYVFVVVFGCYCSCLCWLYSMFGTLYACDTGRRCFLDDYTDTPHEATVLSSQTTAYNNTAHHQKKKCINLQNNKYINTVIRICALGTLAILQREPFFHSHSHSLLLPLSCGTSFAGVMTVCLTIGFSGPRYWFRLCVNRWRKCDSCYKQTTIPHPYTGCKHIDYVLGIQIAVWLQLQRRPRWQQQHQHQHPPPATTTSSTTATTTTSIPVCPWNISAYRIIPSEVNMVRHLKWLVQCPGHPKKYICEIQYS